jgi:Ni/Co efflux regulator RcnB
MRKLIIAGMAVAMLAVPAAASASVSYDDQSVGTVDKQDVQNVFGWNDAKPQDNAAKGNVKFTSKYQMDSTDAWDCGNSIQQRTSRVIQSRVLNVSATKNPHGKVLGWTLNGINENLGGTYLGGERIGAPYVGYCPPGEAFGGFLPHVFTNTVIPGVQVNGADLPNTPAEVTTVA